MLAEVEIVLQRKLVTIGRRPCQRSLKTIQFGGNQCRHRIVVGSFLIVGCGSTLARQMGLAGFENSLVKNALMAGFAAGIILVSQVPAIALRKRVAALEERLARGPEKDRPVERAP